VNLLDICDPPRFPADGLSQVLNPAQ